jgi:hypothetical protein
VSESAAEYFRERRFDMSFTAHTEDELDAIYSSAAGWSRKELRRHLDEGRLGPVFANLHCPDGTVLSGYGTGPTDDAAAVRRWKTEQGD